MRFKGDDIIAVYFRFGSLAAPHDSTIPTAAFGCIADVRFEQKPIFDSPLSANSGRSHSGFEAPWLRVLCGFLYGSNAIEPVIRTSLKVSE